MRLVIVCFALVALGPGLGVPTVLAQGPISQVVAARAGLHRAWYAQVGSPRTTGVVNHVNYDRGLLLVQTDRGLLSGLDAETGRTAWAIQIGPSHRLSTEPAGNEEYVAVVNGSVLYVLDRATGKLLWQRSLGGSPGAGPALSDTHIFVPMISGMVEAYDLKEGSKQNPWFYKSAGRVLMPLMVTPRSVSWTTERGYFYVADPHAGGIRYRLETRGAIHARPAYWTPDVYACSSDGVVYAVNETNGKVDWKFPIGDALHEPPVAIEDKLYVVSEVSGMYCLDSKEGRHIWNAPQIAQFLAVSPTRLYVVDRVGKLAVLDGKTGARLASMPLEGISVRMRNNETDRVYLVNSSNVVQCLHEPTLKTAVVYAPPAPELPKVRVRTKDKKDADAEGAEEDAFGDANAEAMPADEPAKATEDDAADQEGANLFDEESK